MNCQLSAITEKIKPIGVIHIGANTMQELNLYKNLGFENRVWVEANEDVIPRTSEIVFNYAVGSHEGMIKLNVSDNNSESSSCLTPKKHLDYYPEIKFTHQKTVRLITLSKLFSFLSMKDYNYLVLDIQGMELEALNSLGLFKNHFDVIITEAYEEELYEGCGNYLDLITMFPEYNPVYHPEKGKGWGDLVLTKIKI